MKGNKNIAPFGLRLNADLKEWLKEKAHDNRRSLNSEIEHRLAQTRVAEQRTAS